MLKIANPEFPASETVFSGVVKQVCNAYPKTVYLDECDFCNDNLLIPNLTPTHAAVKYSMRGAMSIYNTRRVFRRAYWKVENNLTLDFIQRAE